MKTMSSLACSGLVLFTLLQAQPKKQAAKAAATKGDPKVEKTLSSGRIPPIALGDGTLVGEIRAFATDQVPSGWIECDGRELPTSSPNSQLWSVIGNRFGMGN